MIFEKFLKKKCLKKRFEQMIFEKDIIGIIDKYIGRYRLAKLNIEYHTTFHWDGYIYNKTTLKSYNYRYRNLFKYFSNYKYVRNIHKGNVCELPKHCF